METGIQRHSLVFSGSRCYRSRNRAPPKLLIRLYRSSPLACGPGYYLRDRLRSTAQTIPPMHNVGWEKLANKIHMLQTQGKIGRMPAHPATRTLNRVPSPETCVTLLVV